jgi:four helix bundle protein
MSSDIRSHHDLKVWQLGMDIAKRIYGITRSFPREELYGLSSQLRRAASSIPANIAEGNGRNSTREYLHHLSIAVGSLCEIETFLQLCLRLNLGPKKEVLDVLELLTEEARMLRGLQKSLRSKLENMQSNSNKNKQL